MAAYEPFKRLIEEYGVDWFHVETRKVGSDDAPEMGWELIVHPNEIPNQIAGTWFSHLYIDGKEVDPRVAFLTEKGELQYYFDKYFYKGEPANVVEVHFSPDLPETVTWRKGVNEREIEVGAGKA